MVTHSLLFVVFYNFLFWVFRLFLKHTDWTVILSLLYLSGISSAEQFPPCWKQTAHLSPPASALAMVIRYPDQGKKCHWVWDSSVLEELGLFLCPWSAGVKLLCLQQNFIAVIRKNRQRVSSCKSFNISVLIALVGTLKIGFPVPYIGHCQYSCYCSCVSASDCCILH